MTEAAARASEIAVQQWGMLTTAQAQARGISRVQLSRLTDAGVLERVDQGIYAVPASIDHLTHLRSAWLALDPQAMAEDRLRDPVDSGVVSHTSAASLYGLGDLLDDKPEITVATRKQSRRGTRLHQRRLEADEVTLVDGLPATTPPRTVADLLIDGHDPTHVARIIAEILQRELSSRQALAGALSPVASKYGEPNGYSLLEHLLDLVSLSAAALTAEIASSQLGRNLMVHGQIAATEHVMEALSRVSQAATESAAGILRPTVEKMVKEIQLSILPQVTQPLVRDLARFVDTKAFVASATGNLQPALIALARNIKQLEQSDPSPDLPKTEIEGTEI